MGPQVMSFDYLIEKIRTADFTTAPFKQVYIADFFSPEHFSAITQAPEINLDAASSDDDLFDKLFAAGYKIIDFPGCVTDRDQYIAWHRERRVERNVTNTACEGFGMTLRLMSPKTAVIAQLQEFLVGDQFRNALADKFGINVQDVFPDSGIQKYLDGYEISPHPDVRQKALTYMVNINPHANADELDHHTHYLTFKDRYRYVQAFWEGNPRQERCWVPWDWCDSQVTQTQNNSIVIFAPTNDTIHGVKATYDHLKAQRTQLYGNLWLHEYACDGAPSWEDLVICGRAVAQRRTTAVETLKALVPTSAKDLLKRALSRGAASDPNVIPNRLKQD